MCIVKMRLLVDGAPRSERKKEGVDYKGKSVLKIMVLFISILNLNANSGGVKIIAPDKRQQQETKPTNLPSAGNSLGFMVMYIFWLFNFPSAE